MNPDEPTTKKTTAAQPMRPRAAGVRIAGVTAVVILLLVASFLAGAQYQKQHGGMTHTASAANDPNGMDGRRGMRRMGVIGTVKSISSTSITVTDQRANQDVTYAVTSSTKVTDNGSSSSVSAIKTGARVLVQPTNTSDTTNKTAARIVLNPSMQGGPDVQSNANNTDGTSSDATQTN